MGLAEARLRPLAITVPAAIVLLLTAWVYLRTALGGQLHPALLFALFTGLAFALLASAVTAFGRRAVDIARLPFE